MYMLTTYSVAAGDELHKIWSNFFGYLFTRFRDMIIMEEDESRKNCGCNPSTFQFLLHVVSLSLSPFICEITRLASNNKTALTNLLFRCVVDYIVYDDLWKERIIAERGPHYFAKKSEPVHAKDDESFIKGKAKPTRSFFH
jgi:hypothetical protein